MFKYYNYKEFTVFFIIPALLVLLYFGCTVKFQEPELIYKEICIKGQTYYKGSYFVAIKLSDDGKPIKCKGSE